MTTQPYEYNVEFNATLIKTTDDTVVARARVVTSVAEAKSMIPFPVAGTRVSAKAVVEQRTKFTVKPEDEKLILGKFTVIADVNIIMYVL